MPASGGGARADGAHFALRERIARGDAGSVPRLERA